MPVCECGCGRETRLAHSRFWPGHHRNVPDRALTKCHCGCGDPVRRGRVYLEGHYQRPVAECFDLPREQLAWAAGFIDGEGCFSCTMRDWKRGWISWRLMVGQAMQRPLEELCYMFRGSIRVLRESDGPKHKTFWTWVVQGIDCTSVAKTLLPFLRVKRLQAELICELHETIRKRGSEARFSLTLEEIERRYAFIERMHKLNGGVVRRFRPVSGE